MATHPDQILHLYNSVEAQILYGTPLDETATLLVSLLPGIIMVVIQRNAIGNNYAALCNLEYWLYEYMKSQTPPEQWSDEHYQKLIPLMWSETILSWKPSLRTNLCKIFYPILKYNWYVRDELTYTEQLMISSLQIFRNY